MPNALSPEHCQACYRRFRHVYVVNSVDTVNNVQGMNIWARRKYISVHEPQTVTKGLGRD